MMRLYYIDENIVGTYFHLGKSFDISEANCYRNRQGIEDILIKKTWFSTTCW
ncbi:transposase family protein [Spiroplasma poulsonii]|uniref:transposase family protein n=1 Tax=Spiroplasma poulsonii TaxID=2138 RepID=UPI001F4C92EF|nr:transposase family protein [Spiroplasma poulsonii]UNF62641.1 transposase family protein [Spiroplasma poulsonii]